MIQDQIDVSCVNRYEFCSFLLCCLCGLLCSQMNLLDMRLHLYDEVWLLLVAVSTRIVMSY